MVDQSSQAVSPVGHCPSCGYDQRGLPIGASCPECGRPFWSGVEADDANRWADRAVVGLWSVTILQGIGCFCGLIAAAAFRHTHSGAVMVAIAGAVYLLAGTVWFAAIGIGAAVRVRRPGFKNVSAPLKQSLRKWFIVGAVMVFIPLLPVAHFLLR